jgi:NAD(P)-dependent dehydrogenase (short-subunit alcohol dehydrogenase family)
VDKSRQDPLNIVITGVSRGLGRAIAEEFFRLGHNIFGCARTKTQIIELSNIYPTGDFQAVDVTIDDEVRAWVAYLSERYRAPDFVLNNAAVLNRRAVLWEVTDHDFCSVVDTNLKGIANTVRYFVPWMLHQRRGVILNFSSRWGKQFEERMGAYCASKWAVVALTRVLAEELRSTGISTVALNPGIVNTGLLQQYLQESPTQFEAQAISPVDWARAAAPFILRLRPRDSGKMRTVRIAHFDSSARNYEAHLSSHETSMD